MVTGADIWDDPDFGNFFDKAGEPLTMRQWSNLREDDKYRTIGRTKVGHYLVSTVWLGIDMSFGYGEKVLFETMVFDMGTEEEYPPDLSQTRYSSEEAALAGHQAACEHIEYLYQREKKP